MSDTEKDELYKPISQLKVELDFLQQQCELLGVPHYLLLSAVAGERRGPASARPAVSEVPVLRQAQNGVRTGGETASAFNG